MQSCLVCMHANCKTCICTRTFKLNGNSIHVTYISYCGITFKCYLRGVHAASYFHQFYEKLQSHGSTEVYPRSRRQLCGFDLTSADLPTAQIRERWSQGEDAPLTYLCHDGACINCRWSWSCNTVDGVICTSY